jgi:hypothetical protein
MSGLDFASGGGDVAGLVFFFDVMEKGESNVKVDSGVMHRERYLKSMLFRALRVTLLCRRRRK